MATPSIKAPQQVGGLAKAELRQLDANFLNEINPDKTTRIQFNPDSLKVTFSNQLKAQEGGDQNGPQAIQFSGAGNTKLAVTLNFDVTAELPSGLPDVNDVRKLTQRVAYFIRANKEGSGKSAKYIPPAIRFIWGTFVFDGVMESMDETLEMFSAEGRPLRANVTVGITRQEITEFSFAAGVKDPPAVTRRGGSGGWQAIATANGIENPRLLDPGQLIDLNPPSLNVNVGIGVNADVSVGVDVSASVQIG